MMDNVQAAMSRMAAIRSTMGLGQAAAPPPQTSTLDAPHAAVHSMFSHVLSQAQHAVGVPRWDTLNGLTPVAGTVQKGPPAGLEGFENGRIPAEALAPVAGTDERMWAPAAAAFGHMRRDAAQAGISLPVVDAYRPLHDQVRLAEELGLYREGGLAAVPGTSQHGWGRAIDLQLDDTGLAWMRENAWKYGFVEPVPRESWHWEFHPAG